ncbi:hypothetical protein DQ384_36495 [Sphaerisporangium album]|uniref:Uncharacterized protein n=1 Tax=Sphaerisporangium album TaxID=509200 RepID=A0A367ESL5_9ACTN|nr:hypothetical protein [Sphaerisporangium album]RCG21118.1 hypothetical protein DQ384_36495 [Sphaerisporangium album]
MPRDDSPNPTETPLLNRPAEIDRERERDNWESTLAIGSQVWWVDADASGPGVIAGVDHQEEYDRTLVLIFAWDYETGGPFQVHVDLNDLRPLTKPYDLHAEDQSHLDELTRQVESDGLPWSLSTNNTPYSLMHRFATEEDALEALAKQVRAEWWRVTDLNIPTTPTTAPDSDADAIAIYYAALNDRQTYQLTRDTPAELGPHHVGAPSHPVPDERAITHTEYALHGTVYRKGKPTVVTETWPGRESDRHWMTRWVQQVIAFQQGAELPTDAVLYARTWSTPGWAPATSPTVTSDYATLCAIYLDTFRAAGIDAALGADGDLAIAVPDGYTARAICGNHPLPGDGAEFRWSLQLHRTVDAAQFTYLHPIAEDIGGFAATVRDLLNRLPILRFAHGPTWAPGTLHISAEQATNANDAVIFHPRHDGITLPCMELDGAQAYLYVDPRRGALRVSLELDGAEDWLITEDCVPVVFAVNGATVLDTTRLGASGAGFAADPLATLTAIYRLWHALRALYATPEPAVEIARLVEDWFADHGMALRPDQHPPSNC